MHHKNYEAALNECEGKAVLLCVSKYHSVEEAMKLYDAGVRDFGENHAQELLKKSGAMPKDIRWHFIGHLQKDKVKKVVPIASLIESLDSLELAAKIEAVAGRCGKVMPCLIEVHLAEEDTEKTGVSEAELLPLAEACLALPHLQIRGIMVMGPHTEDESKIRAVFEKGHRLFSMLKARYGEAISVYSAGMSGDYRIALTCGSTEVRLGSCLFEK